MRKEEPCDESAVKRAVETQKAKSAKKRQSKGSTPRLSVTNQEGEIASSVEGTKAETDSTVSPPERATAEVKAEDSEPALSSLLVKPTKKLFRTASGPRMYHN